MRIQIVTCNTKRENGKYKGSYHEIHEIDNLRNIDHIISTIDSIITNNLLYKDITDVLDFVIISGDNTSILDMIMSHYLKYPSFVSIMSAETAMLTI